MLDSHVYNFSNFQEIKLSTCYIGVAKNNDPRSYLEIINKNLAVVYLVSSEDGASSTTNGHDVIGCRHKTIPHHIFNKNHIYQTLAFVYDIDLENDRIILRCDNTKNSFFDTNKSYYLVKTERGLDQTKNQMQYLNDYNDDFIERFDRMNMVTGSDVFSRVKTRGKVNGMKRALDK